MIDFASIPAHTCYTADVVLDPGELHEMILVTADANFSRSLSLTTLRSPTPNAFRVSACNPTNAAINPANSLFWWDLRRLTGSELDRLVHGHGDVSEVVP
jgi:hypothetical protein